MTSVYWALFHHKEWRALLRIDCLLGLCLDAKWSNFLQETLRGTGFYGGTRNSEKQQHFKSVDHQKQRLEFTLNFVRFAQAHLSLKLLRLKKSFDLTCSRVVSV